MDTFFKDKKGDPFYVLGLQAHNSSTESAEMIETSIKAVKAYNGNTLEAPVYWYQIEPEEGRFDFTLVKRLITQVRESNLHLVILWFGFSKNCDITYNPAWVKKDKKRFKLAKGADGGVVPMLSPFCMDTIEADKKAFVRLMDFVRSYDENERTVVAVQVENEIGLYNNDRDYSKTAQTYFDMGVPAELNGVFLKDSEASGKDNTWYGRYGIYAHEAFSAWYFGKAVEKIASAGKSVYPDMPLFMNTSIGENRQEVGGQSYPSGAPVGRMIEIFQKAAPTICCFAADIYLQHQGSYLRTCAAHSMFGNPLFIPETGIGGVAFALNHIHAAIDYNALGICGFGAETTLMPDGTLTKEAAEVADTMKIISMMSPLILKYGGTDKLFCVTQEEFQSFTYVKREKYHITFNYTTKNEKGRPLGSNLRLATELNANPDLFNKRGRAIVFEASPTEYYIAGEGLTARFLKRTDPEDRFPSRTYMSRAATELTAFKIEEGHFTDRCEWVSEFVRSGDEIDCGAFVYPGIVLRVLLNPDACVPEDW